MKTWIAVLTLVVGMLTLVVSILALTVTLGVVSWNTHTGESPAAEEPDDGWVRLRAPIVEDPPTDESNTTTFMWFVLAMLGTFFCLVLLMVGTEFANALKAKWSQEAGNSPSN